MNDDNYDIGYEKGRDDGYDFGYDDGMKVGIMLAENGLSGKMVSFRQELKLLADKADNGTRTAIHLFLSLLNSHFPDKTDSQGVDDEKTEK